MPNDKYGPRCEEGTCSCRLGRGVTVEDLLAKDGPYDPTLTEFEHAVAAYRSLPLTMAR